MSTFMNSRHSIIRSSIGLSFSRLLPERQEAARVLYTGYPRCLDLPAYEQKHHPAVLLSCSGMRSQSQTDCADLFRLVPDSYYQVVDQKVD